MKWLSAGLTFINVTTICGCLEGIAAHGLNKTVAASSAIAGFVAALIAYWGTSNSSEDETEEVAANGVTPVPAPMSVDGQTQQRESIFTRARRRYKSIWLWAMVAVFAMFAFRSFCNVYFIDGNEYKIQNPNNLGDLSLHITYIKTFASGVAMWPENPIYVFSKLRYPAGIDLFNAILLCLDISVVRGLVLVGLGASAALCYALFRWGGAFTIAGFLFNGGIAGWQWFRNYEWKDFQSSNYIAWKSLALTMLVTQRGLLYALPAGLLLLCHWRAKYFPSKEPVLAEPPPRASSSPSEVSDSETADITSSNDPSVSGDSVTSAEVVTSNDSISANDSVASGATVTATAPVTVAEPVVVTESVAIAESVETSEPESVAATESVAPVESAAPTSVDTPVVAVAPAPLKKGILPFWVELSLYATMPLFHVHTFMALSFVLLFLFLFLDSQAKKRLFLLGATAFIPATFFLWLITDHFHAGSVLSWNPGWVQNNGDFARPLAAFSAQPNPVAPPAATGLIGVAKQFIQFWWINFGITLPLIIALVVLLAVRAWKYRGQLGAVNVRLVSLVGALAGLLILLAALLAYLSLGYSLWVVLAIIPPVGLAIMMPLFASLLQRSWKQTIPLSTSLAFIIPAVVLFIFSCLVKTAPWEWDNIKLIIWSYLIILPFLWSELISRWAFPIKAVVCIAMFGSGFFTLFGGLAAGRTGYGMADRAELDAVDKALQKVPLEGERSRFAGFPTFNHPVLLSGRKMILGYPGHIWTQGFSYGEDNNKLNTLMNGAPDWRQTAKNFKTRYLFWGREEIKNYSQSKKPWEQECKVVATGPWGTIYDLETPKEQPVPAATPAAANPGGTPMLMPAATPSSTPAATAK